MDIVLHVSSRLFVGLLVFACFTILIISALLVYDYFKDKISIHIYNIKEKFKHTKLYPVYKIIETWGCTIIFILAFLFSLYLIGFLIIDRLQCI